MQYRVMFIDGSILYKHASCSSGALLKAIAEQSKADRSIIYKSVALLKKKFTLNE